MAELIQKTDTLNEGREKLNESIKDAEKAKINSSEALDTANTALSKSESTQTQLDNIVIDGDSSVEAAQARVDAEGKSYPTLKARLDAKETEFSSQLADTDEQVINKRMSDNASYIEPFYIETFDGSNEPYHPAVVYFTNPEGWNGYRFWMVHTPFPIANKPPYRARWECPSILRSPDGQDWRKPFNAPNPLVDLTQEEIDRGDYYSDPCIVMNGQTMEIWYRKTNGANRTQTDIYRITTDDGETFTKPEIVLAPLRPDNGFPGTMGMRAQQVFLNGSKYEAFFSLQGGEIGRAHV